MYIHVYVQMKIQIQIYIYIYIYIYIERERERKNKEIKFYIDIYICISIQTRQDWTGPSQSEPDREPDRASPGGPSLTEPDWIIIITYELNIELQKHFQKHVPVKKIVCSGSLGARAKLSGVGRRAPFTNSIFFTFIHTSLSLYIYIYI